MQTKTSHTHDSDKRKTLKTLGVSAGVAAASTATGTVAAEALINPVPSAQGSAKHTDSAAVHQLTINVQLNRHDLDDWVLLENMTEAPLVAKSFKPRYVQYGNTVLDLNALLMRQQKGKKQLELWPNHAWTHSTRGATRASHPLRPVDAQIVSVNSDTRSIQIAAQIDNNGQVLLSPVG